MFARGYTRILATGVRQLGATLRRSGAKRRSSVERDWRQDASAKRRERLVVGGSVGMGDASAKRRETKKQCNTRLALGRFCEASRNEDAKIVVEMSATSLASTHIDVSG